MACSWLLITCVQLLLQVDDDRHLESPRLRSPSSQPPPLHITVTSTTLCSPRSRRDILDLLHHCVLVEVQLGAAQHRKHLQTPRNCNAVGSQPASQGVTEGSGTSSHNVRSYPMAWPAARLSGSLRNG